MWLALGSEDAAAARTETENSSANKHSKRAGPRTQRPNPTNGRSQATRGNDDISASSRPFLGSFECWLEGPDGGQNRMKEITQAAE